MDMTEKTLRFIFLSIISTANATRFDDDAKDVIINECFNTLVNYLQPKQAMVFLDIMLEKTGKLEYIKMFENSSILNKIDFSLINFN